MWGLCLGFGVWGLGFEVWGLGFGVGGWGLRVLIFHISLHVSVIYIIHFIVFAFVLVSSFGFRVESLCLGVGTDRGMVILMRDSNAISHANVKLSLVWVRGWRFGVYGLGFRVYGLGFGVWGLGFAVRGVVFGVWCFGFGVWCSVFGVWVI